MTCPAEIQLTLGSFRLPSPSQDSGGQGSLELLCSQDPRHLDLGQEGGDAAEGRGEEGHGII